MNEPASNRSLLRFITCGSVDDGKSTLIGRLLHDTGRIFEDQFSAVERASRRYGTVGDDVDLALLVDGLECEREQGITIDVAYRFFATPARAFIVADTPGHEQYTRNMATGASTADLAIVLIDSRKGLLAQTRRHSKICALMGIRHVILAINKIDLVAFDQSVFNAIVAAYRPIAEQLGFATAIAIPLSARYGDNVVARSARTSWYAGPTLLAALEAAATGEDEASAAFRFPVQWVNRPNLDFRGLAGTIASGTVSRGDPIVVAHSGRTTTVRSIVTFDGEREQAVAGEAVTLVLEDEVDAARGDVLALPTERPEVTDQFAAHIVWMGEEPLQPGRSYLLTCGCKSVPARVIALKHRINVDTYAEAPARTLALNDIGLVNVSTNETIAFDPYSKNKRTGAFILVDRQSNATVGAGMIEFGLRRATNLHRHHHRLGKAARAGLMHQKPAILWFTGLSGSGKSTIANLVEEGLHARGLHTMLLDGDNVRHGLNRDLEFTVEDRIENIRRIGEVSKLMVEAGLIVICSFISPFTAERTLVREMVETDEFVEIFVDLPIEECIRRDPKGLYKLAIEGRLPNFTGIGSPYERPVRPEIRIDGMAMTAEAASVSIIDWFLNWRATA